MATTPIYQVITDWQLENSPGGQTVMYFDTLGDSIEQIREDLGTFWAALEDHLHAFTDWEVRGEGKILSGSTGNLVDIWNEPTDRSGAGNVSGQPVSNSTELLLRWNTNEIVGNRLLKGRTFVPGLSNQATIGGQVAGNTLTAIAAAAATFRAAAPLVVWHRPVGGTGGQWGNVTTSSVWSELAVLRHRR